MTIKKHNDCLIKISDGDNVAVILGENGPEGIEPGHKVAAADIEEGAPVYKYGYPMGWATRHIKAGEWVHSHNIASGLRGEQEYRYRPETVKPVKPDWIPGEDESSFPGYHRPDGRVGVRNEIWIINTVGCCNGTARILAKRGQDICRQAGVDGPFHFDHVHGCSQLGEDMSTTRRILAGLVHHPNAGGVLVLGLGCENNHIDIFREEVGDCPPGRVRWLNTQDCTDEINAGLQHIEKLAAYAGGFQRGPVPAGELVIGLKCGGSDAFSGITANPLVGRFTDVIIHAGGSALLTEVPEMFGAEEVLLNRCVDATVFREAVDMINNFKKFFINQGQPVYENPSPGNLRGGITTLEEKSLGCVLKGGHGPVTGVLQHGERVRKKGISLMDGPGNDLVSVTALTAAGAQLILFTTGRGTPFGGPVPTIKIASNSRLARRKKHWTDFDAETYKDNQADGLKSLYRLVMDIASGRKKAVNEEHGFREIAMFKTGVTL